MDDNDIKNHVSIERLQSLLSKILISKTILHQLDLSNKQNAFIYALYLFNKHSRAFIPMSFYRIGLFANSKQLLKSQPKAQIGKKKVLINQNKGDLMLKGIKSIIKRDIIPQYHFQYNSKRSFNRNSNVTNLAYYTIMKLNYSKWKRQSKAIKYRAYDISKERIKIKKVLIVINTIVLKRKIEYSNGFIKSLKRIVIKDKSNLFKNDLMIKSNQVSI